MRDELTVALFDSALVATRGDSGLLGRWLTLGPWSRWLATRGDSARRGPRRGDSARRAVWRGRGLGGRRKRYGGAVEQVYMDEENADDDYSYVSEKPLPAQGPG